jgi:hypothetical protein
MKAARPTPKPKPVVLESEEVFIEGPTQMEFELLQDEAIELNLPTEREGVAIEFAELQSMVEAAKAGELQAYQEHMAAKAARKPQEAAESEGARVTRPEDSEAVTGRPVALAPNRLAELQSRIGLPPEELVRGLGLSAPTLEDYETANAYGYPVAIQGAKPYRTVVSMFDPLGGKDREAGGVILLIDAHTKNKLEYLIPL